MKMPTFKRLNKNDFGSEYKELVDKLSFIINDGFETIYQALDGRLNSDNKLEVVKDAQIQVNDDGIPQQRINCSLAGSKIQKVIGCQVISVNNLTIPTLYPQAGITVTWTQEGNSVTINHLTGITPDTIWSIRFLIIGGS